MIAAKMMITTRTLRAFAADCLVEASRVGDASRRQMMIDVARSWASTAEAIDRRVRDGRNEVLSDLRHKLN